MIAVLFSYNRSRKNRRSRKVWVHPMLQKRRELSAFRLLYFRMLRTSFDELQDSLQENFAATKHQNEE
ncbi:hypothetical protein PR048_013297 [Dryococelus australis]|uniref:Uncharacterized protein n=1 Tax=Dryococelus australis TaxID=614101 RepID=A0ABQ9HRU7_9NEOP|nr:hypothetical protein PR048_013297 [Dryococelus australis]